MNSASNKANLDPTENGVDRLPEVDLSQEPLDADRPWLEQLEERALGDAKTFALLEREIYPNREIMSLLM